MRRIRRHLYVTCWLTLCSGAMTIYTIKETLL